MTQPETASPVPTDEKIAEEAAGAASAAAVETEAEAEPQPEPWTPERVSEWNAYYDFYVMLAALLLCFVASAVRINNAAIWSHLKTGELIADQGAPVVSDPFSYTEQGQRWVNIPWLFQWSHAALFRAVKDLVPVDPNDPTANRASAEQIGVGALIALDALARVLAAFILMRIRRPGPGLWWTALCTVFALGAIYVPFDVILGGIAGPGDVAPTTWGLLFLATEMLLLHRAYNEGRTWGLYALVPLFALWANMDDSFFMGLLILAAAVIGRMLDGQIAESLIQPVDTAIGSEEEGSTELVRPVPIAAGLMVLAGCIAACLANPSTYRVFFAVVSPFLRLFGPKGDFITADQLSYFGEGIRQQAPNDWYWMTVYYLVIVALGLASFLMNARRFAWSRFLPFAVAAVCWGIFIRFRPEFAIVIAVTLALNGQEWYQDRFGTQGRLGSLWTGWSTGGRVVTLGFLFYCVFVGITGWQRPPETPRFGFGYDANDFPLESAEYLARREDIKGNILNTTLAQGDALIWKAYPTRKTFLDGRSNLFSQELLEEHHRLRNALRDDDVAAWKPTLDKYGVTAVMIDSTGAPNTYRTLTQSPNWIPFYDDGRGVMFGRADAAEPDLTAFKNNKLEPDLRAYKVSEPIPSADRPPTPTTWIDEIFRNRLMGRLQSHNNAAGRWLQGANFDETQPNIPNPARCLLAIREARTSLAKNPDDWVAYRLLNTAYRLLAAQEAALMAGIPLTPQNQARVSTLSPTAEVLSTRFRQRVTALNYAIQTTPPPRSPEARRELQALNLEISQLFLQTGFVDVARDRLQIALEQSDPSDFTPEQRAQLQQQLDQLNQRVQQIQDNLMDLQVERQAGPLEKAAYARGQGALGLAIGELEEAERGNMAPMVVKPQLLDLYCDTGQPDKALDMLGLVAGEDRNLGTEAGTPFMRQGQVYHLLGNYLSAASLWQGRAIPALRFDRSSRALTTAQILGRGELVSAVNAVQTIPGLVTRQASWEFELAQCLLESGTPDQAAEHYTQALKLAPDLPVRPIIAYYLEKMGRPVPALPAQAAATTATPAPASALDQVLKGTGAIPVAAPTGPRTSPPGTTTPAPSEPNRLPAPKDEPPTSAKNASSPAPDSRKEETKKP
jgi:tetratricopeptide (TPR) repeat protein